MLSFYCPDVARKLHFTFIFYKIKNSKNGHTMLVSIIIPAWNLWGLTAACLQSLAESSPHENVEIIVVDNGSTDDTATELDALGSALFGDHLRVVRPGKNVGFSRGCNLGAATASGDLLFFLNNDTIARPGWFDPLVAAQGGKTGAAGPLLYYPDGSLQHCGISFGPFCNVRHIYEFFPGDHPVATAKRPLQAITGAAFMLPAALFHEAGGFCEDYVNGFEDIDLCCRLTSMGRVLAIAPGSVFEHHVSQTPGRFDHDSANARLLRERWGHKIRPDLHILGQLDGYVLAIGEDLSAWLQTKPEVSTRLASAASGNVDALRTQLHAQPLWLEGWQLLMDALAARGNAHSAFQSGQMALRHFHAPAIMARMNALLCAAEPRAQTPAFNLCADAASLEDNSERVRMARRDAWRRGDKILASSLDQWLDRHATPQQARC